MNEKNKSFDKINKEFENFIKEWRVWGNSKTKVAFEYWYDQYLNTVVGENASSKRNHSENVEKRKKILERMSRYAKDRDSQRTLTWCFMMEYSDELDR